MTSENGMSSFSKVSYILADIGDVIPGVCCETVEPGQGVEVMDGNMLHASLPDIDVLGVQLVSVSGAS